MPWVGMTADEGANLGDEHLPSSWRLVLWAGAIVVLGAIVRISLSPQFDGLDDAGYLDAALRVARHEQQVSHNSLFYLRVGMSYPLGWLMRLGMAPGSFWILNTAVECVTIVVLVAMAWRLFGRFAGLTAGLLYAGYPLAIGQTTLYMPTVYQITCIAIALWLLDLSRNGARVQTWAPAFLSGVCLGLGYLVKEDVALLVPAIVVTALVTRYRPLSCLATVCIGSAWVVGAECVFHYVYSGSPFYRFLFNASAEVRPSSGLDMAGLWSWDAFVRPLFIMPYQVGVYWWLAVPALVTAILKGRVAERFVAGVFSFLFLYLQFGSTSILKYVPLPKSARYTAIMTPMLILLLGWWIGRIYQGGYRRWTVAIVAGLVVTSVPCIIVYSVTASERTRNVVAVAGVLQERGLSTVYTDRISGRLLRSLAATELDVRDWFQADFARRQMMVVVHTDELRGEYVFLDSQGWKVYTSSYGLRLPDEVRSVLEQSDVLWSGNAYPKGGWQRAMLEGIRSIARHLPIDYVAKRIVSNCDDMIENDGAALLRVRDKMR